MAELYGITSVIKPSVSEAPVTIGTELVFIGTSNTSSHLYEPVKCTSRDDIQVKYGAYEKGSFEKIARYAFDKLHLDHLWLININDGTVPAATFTENSITADNVKNGVDALDDIYMHHGAVPSLVVLPYNQMHGATPGDVADYAAGKCRNLNGLFKAQVVIDNTVNYSSLEENMRGETSLNSYTIPDADIGKDCSDGNCILCIGNIRVTPNPNSFDIPMSIVVACNRAYQDAMNPASVPCRSVGNLDCRGAVDYTITYTNVSGSSRSFSTVPLMMSKSEADSLTEFGFIVARNKGMNRYITWGDHTAAVEAGDTGDELNRFDSNVAMAYHLANRWILKWEHTIDRPMTLALRNDIINEEQTYLNYLVAVGALVGNPKCEFRPVDNTSDSIGQGQFYFTNTYTNAIPTKYLQLNLVWTSEGLASYLEG